MMLKDVAEVTFIAGKGGDGLVSFGKMAHSGPDGGNGGRGGDIYLIAENDLKLLNQFSRKYIFSADNGEPGGKNKKTGKNGKDLEIKIPMGSTLVDKQTGKEIYSFEEKATKFKLCAGGEGGRGNYEFRSSRRTTPMFAEDGKPGEKKEVIINLKLIADFGLIGLPNAGKSSLLNELTSTKAKTANYPFTTLTPNLGVINTKIIADIPGLIEGASKGRGLGFSFLKHIEKVKVILHCVSCESDNPHADYNTVRKELEIFNRNLIAKKEIILLTKCDLISTNKLNLLIRKFKKVSQFVMPVSIHDWESLEKLKNAL